MRAIVREIIAYFREVGTKWSNDRAVSHGAALAYYTIFSLAPLLVLVIAVVGLVFGRAAVQGEIVGQIEDLVGPDVARTVEAMIARLRSPAAGVIATVTSLATMLLGASTALAELQSALNRIWHVDVELRGRGRGLVRRRLASFTLVLSIGVLLLLSMVLSAALVAVQEPLARWAPALAPTLGWLNFALTFAVTSALFALVFKVLPDARMPWRDVWLGGVATALLFTVGKSLIAWYLGRTGTTSVYGAAGSLVLLLVWVYYSAQIVLLGAELTEVYSRRYGSRRRLLAQARELAAAPPEASSA